MKTLEELHSVSDVARHFGITEDQVIARCKAPTNAWPHVRPARPAKSWRFTDEDIEAIEKAIARRTRPVDSWGREIRRSA